MENRQLPQSKEAIYPLNLHFPCQSPLPVVYFCYGVKVMDSTYNGVDRRRHKRLRVNFIATYAVNEPFRIRLLVGGENIYTRMFDLSESGMALLTNYNIPSATIISVKFVLINLRAYKATSRSRPLDIRGEVVYSISYEENEHRMGICFKDLYDEDKCFVSDFIICQSNYNTLSS